MAHVYTTLISAAELVRTFDGDARRPLLLDVRHSSAGRRAYLEGHLAEAIFVDSDRELAGPSDDPALGGRHPLPPTDQWIATLTRLGLEPNRQIVAYDAAGGALAAARAWWMLRASGHEPVAVLDGGIEAATAAGLELESGERAPQPTATPYPFTGWSWPTATIEETARTAGDAGAAVIDVRSAERYYGETEPFDPVPGRIPGAANVPYTENFGANGCLLDRERLAALYRDRTGVRPDEAVIHCGSGITACLTILAMVHAGLDVPRLYVGSWSEWCRAGREIGRGRATDRGPEAGP